MQSSAQACRNRRFDNAVRPHAPATSPGEGREAAPGLAIEAPPHAGRRLSRLWAWRPRGRCPCRSAQRVPRTEGLQSPAARLARVSTASLVGSGGTRRPFSARRWGLGVGLALPTGAPAVSRGLSVSHQSKAEVCAVGQGPELGLPGPGVRGVAGGWGSGGVEVRGGFCSCDNAWPLPQPPPIFLLLPRDVSETTFLPLVLRFGRQ